MEPAHILFLTDVLYSTHGGAEGVLKKITRMLPPERFRCSIATFASYTALVASQEFDCPVHLFPIERIYGWSALRNAIRLARLIRSQQIDIVHTFFPASDLLGGVVAKLSGCPILVSSRRDMGFQRSAMHRLAYRIVGRLFDQVHAVADEVRLRHIQQDKLDPNRVVTLYNGADLDEIDRSPAGSLADLGVEDASHVVVLVANIRPIKALETFVSAAAIVCRELPRARFLVVGAFQDGNYLSQIEQLAQKLSLDRNVIFVGRRSEIPSILKACGLFFLSSRSEGLSNAMLEAMACALPCVATDVGGNRELIEHGRNGYLVRVDDPAGAAQRILELLRDRSQARRMGQEGRRIAEANFSVQAMMTRLIELYDELLGKNNGSATRHVNHRPASMDAMNSGGLP